MADYDGGIGGKFRRRPFRRPAATPYERPPAAIRAARGRNSADLAAEGSSGGWLSKIVHPASRLIATGATRFFSSVFQKRLIAQPPQQQQQAPAPEGNRQSRQDVPELACTVPSSELQKEEDGDKMRKSFDNDGIAALEQLLKEKTFTRVEFDRLAELLRSRTVEPLKVTEVNNEEQCQAPHQQFFNNEKVDNINVSAQENKIGSSKVHERLVVHRGSLPDQTASPTELAKVYMSMGPSKTSPSALSLRSQVFKEDRKLPSIPSPSKSLDLSVAPRSTNHFSGVSELTENGYRTPRPLGRSAICRMSRSPYFKVNSTANVQTGELNGDVYTCKSLSQWTPRSAIPSDGKQVSKRGRSVLDGDFRSVGPIRRIRQKCNLSSPSKDSRPSLSGSPLSSPLTSFSKEVIEGSTSVQKPLLLAPIPPQSSETAHKLFQQLDKLLPSPTERASKMKTIDSDESPSKLTLDMLRGRARRSMEEIDASKFSSMQDIGIASDSHLPTIRSFSSGKVDMVEENGRSKYSTLGIKLTSETNGLKNASIPSKDANPGSRSTYAVVSDYELPQSKRPSFQMSAPEDSLEMDDDVDDYNMRNLASPLTKEKSGAESKKPESQSVFSETEVSEAALKMPKKNNIFSETASSEAELKIPNHKEVVHETAISERPLVSSSQSTVVSNSILFKEADNKAFALPVVSEIGTGFTFPITSDPCSRSQQSPAPTEPSPWLNQTAFQKEQTSLFSSGSSAANIFAVPSTTVDVNDTAGVKVDAGTGSELKSSISDAISTLAEGSNLIKAAETQKAEDIFKSFGHVSSGLSMSTTPSFSFGASTAPPTPSNGSLGRTSSTSSLSATPTTTQSETPSSSIFLSGTPAMASSRPSFSSAAPVFSTIPSFQNGSGAPNASVAISSDKSNLPGLEAEPAKSSPFGICNSTALGTSAFPSTSSSYSTNFVFSSSGSALVTSDINSSTTSSFSTLGTSSLFSSLGGNSSFALSSSLPSTGSSIFGFGASTQSSSSSPSLANSNSQNSTTTSCATVGSAIGAQVIHSGNGTSLISKSSTSHLTSFSSSPAFGLSNPSSNSFGVMAVGSAPSGAKPFTPSSGFSVSTGASPTASTSLSFMPAASAALFGSSSQASTSSIFGSTSISTTSSSTGFSFGLSAPDSGSSTSISTSSLSTGFSFGQSASASGSSPFMFGSSSGPAFGSSSRPAFGSSSGPASGSGFSFTSANPTASSTSPASTQPAFGVSNPAIGFGSVMSGSPGNDQMNVEDTMTEDTNQAPSFLTFGQLANHSASPSFTFGSPAVQPASPSVFQFGSHPNPSAPQNPSPFQATGNLEFSQGGSFSLGSGGGDKAGRKFVRVSRNKQRKK